MKKLLQVTALLTLSAFFLPVLTVGFGPQPEEDTLLETENPVFSPVGEASLPTLSPAEGYDQSQTITLWQDGTVRKLTLREYLIGVVAAEMPAGFPEEALKAQAVAARSYALYKLALYEKSPQEEHHGAQLCADSGHCEAFVDLAVQASQLWPSSSEVYAGRIENAVTETDGWVLTWEQEPIAAVFCAASGPKTEASADIWGRELPYLVSVDSPGGEDCGKYYGEVCISQTEFVSQVQKTLPEAVLSGPAEEWFQEVQRSPAGSVLSLKLGGTAISGREMRSLAGLNSANFTVRLQDDQLIFETEGYGHGVGMSQYGARYLALAGESCEAILSHYYPGTLLERR